MKLIPAFLDILFPRGCVGCGGDVRTESRHICWDCMRTFHVIHSPFCSICGDPVDGLVEAEYVCSSCRDWPPAFDMARSAVRHRGVLRGAIHAFKYSGRIAMVPDLVDLLNACVTSFYTDLRLDAVTYVPLFPSKERERTFNQSRLLARELARQLGVPTADCLIRSRYTPAQAGLKAANRRRNVRGAFSARESDWLRGRRILLVDDVMTTGSTVGECARTLKKAGATYVAVVTVARG